MTNSPSNKRIGTEYEREVVKLLSQYGYWAHRFEEDRRGAQPFDIIAVKNGIPYAIDAKTLDDKSKTFYISRLEDNQIYAFEHWIKCGNNTPFVFVKWRGQSYIIDYLSLKLNCKADMDTVIRFDGVMKE